MQSSVRKYSEVYDDRSKDLKHALIKDIQIKLWEKHLLKRRAHRYLSVCWAICRVLISVNMYMTNIDEKCFFQR
jgi:hypothetical protein